MERHSLANYLPDWREGRVAGFVVVVTEVTQLRKTQAALAREKQLRLELEQRTDTLNQLLRERDELIDLLAHEVRQPLHSAWSAFQGAEAAIRGNRMDSANDALVQARSMLGSVTATIDNTLAAARLLAGRGTLTLADTDLDMLVALTLGDLPPSARRRITVRSLTAVRSALVDSGLMRLALRNLLRNAIEYSPHDSPIQIELSEQEEPPELHVDVVDTGPGVPRELVSRLFERGVTGRQGEQAAGHGLGLYVVRRVMELHGGRAELLTPGTPPTRFRLRLNLALDP
ncbi:sensor histidine kinase [Inhella proteolytica]|uniref:histidine kinase n=1 Tax=Inhella proteolytica TaxID=2795029 RepID=A0A931J7D8_9BURK|nr:sensor histidine kinase [Inhella proteolytica]MBH9579625.1 sensor histidine kinase [Inhella proteolytica]